MVFNFAFANDTILSWSFFISLIIHLGFLIHPVIAKKINPTAEFAMPLEISTKEAKAEIETNSVTTEA